MNTITLYIYLKHKRRPFVIEFDSRQCLEKFYDSLSHDIITIGPLTFLRENFKYSIEK